MKISIITAVRNGVDTISDCIESVREQNHSTEHIIIDGLSSDGTIELVKQNRPPGLVFVSEPDKGYYDAINKGLKLATGNIIGILNADDIYAHEHVLEKVSVCFSNRTVNTCYGDLVYVESFDTMKVRRYWRSGLFNKRRFLHGWMPPHPTFFVRREIYEKYGDFNLELGTAADYELMLRFLFKNEISTHYIPEVLVKMRTGGQSNSSLNIRLMANRMDRRAWAINGLVPYPWTLLMKPIRKISQYFLKSL